ncbi:hypothetical protein AB0I28_37695 [Phytomonospora sp. NPDC050363]|uniref:hypothetical protein n=1 Tax=Phytomonospora sp. NPDC050363 TaxID=3155642 RepID=UPI0033C13514
MGSSVMVDEGLQFGSADDVVEFIENLDIAAPLRPAEAAAMLAGSPKSGPTTVVKTLRVSPELDAGIRQAASAAGMSVSRWMRRALEQAAADHKAAARPGGDVLEALEVLSLPPAASAVLPGII